MSGNALMRRIENENNEIEWGEEKLFSLHRSQKLNAGNGPKR